MPCHDCDFDVERFSTVAITEFILNVQSDIDFAATMILEKYNRLFLHLDRVVVFTLRWNHQASIDDQSVEGNGKLMIIFTPCAPPPRFVKKKGNPLDYSFVLL